MLEIWCFLSLTFQESLCLGDLSLFVADFSSLGVEDLLPFVTDFTREFRYERFDAICRLLFKRAYMWEIWCYLLLTFLENLSTCMMIWCYLSLPFQESLGVGDLVLFVTYLPRGGLGITGAIK